jgi:hypothetical protein
LNALDKRLLFNYPSAGESADGKEKDACANSEKKEAEQSAAYVLFLLGSFSLCDLTHNKSPEKVFFRFLTLCVYLQRDKIKLFIVIVL